MNNQEIQIILGVILLILAYALFIRRSEGMVAAATAATPPPASSCQTAAMVYKGSGKYELYKRVRPLAKCGTVVGGYTALKMADVERRSNILWEGRPGTAPEGHPAKKVFKISTARGSNHTKTEITKAFIYFFMNKLTNINRVYVRSRRELIVFAVPPNSKTKPMPSDSRYSFAAYKMTPVGAGVLVAAAPTAAAAKAALGAAAAAKLTPGQWAAGDKKAAVAGAPPVPGAPAAPGVPAPTVGPKLLAPPAVPGVAPPAPAALIATPAAAASVRAAPTAVAGGVLAAPAAVAAVAAAAPAALRAPPGDPATAGAVPGTSLLHSTHKPPKPSAAATPSTITPVAAAPWVASATAAGWHKHPL